MQNIAKAADILAAQSAILRYWSIVDGKLDAPVAPCLTPDCFMKIEGMEISGRDTLVAAVAERSAKAAEQGRTTRHLISNLRVTEQMDGGLAFDSLLAVFSGYGDRPMPMEVPSSLGDFSYRCTQDDAGDWRISRIEGAIIFASGDSPFAKRAP